LGHGNHYRKGKVILQQGDALGVQPRHYRTVTESLTAS
jgi:hypothetical protein